MKDKKVESPPDVREDRNGHQLYDKAAKAALSKEAVVGLMVKRSVILPEEIGRVETDFLENEFSSVFASGAGNVRSSRLISDRIARIRREGKPTVFLVLEIQSRPDGNMAVRMKHYADALLDRLLGTGQGESSFCIYGLVVNIGLDCWTPPVSLTGFIAGKGRELIPTESMPECRYLLESAEILTGTEEGRKAFSRLPMGYRELDVYLGMIRRCMEARTIVSGDERLGRKWWLLFCLMTRRELGVNIDLLREEEPQEKEGFTMEEILRNYRTSLLNEGRIEGRAEETVQSICKLVRKNFSIHQAMDLLDVPEEERRSYGEKAEALLSSSL